jgi:hypothetical protein
MDIPILAVILIIFLVIEYYYFSMLKKEHFTNTNNIRYGPFQPIANTRLVDPLVCYPGTYWRNGTYSDTCSTMNQKRPMRMSVEGEPRRIPNMKYEMVCSPDEHLNRNCQFVKVYDKYY